MGKSVPVVVPSAGGKRVTPVATGEAVDSVANRGQQPKDHQTRTDAPHSDNRAIAPFVATNDNETAVLQSPLRGEVCSSHTIDR